MKFVISSSSFFHQVIGVFIEPLNRTRVATRLAMGLAMRVTMGLAMRVTMGLAMRVTIGHIYKIKM